jgi:hypothetical protein
LLSPTRGRLKGRLDHETRLHMPLPPLSANAACQLHHWAHKESNPMDKTEGANVKPSGSHAHVMRKKVKMAATGAGTRATSTSSGVDVVKGQLTKLFQANATFKR